MPATPRTTAGRKPATKATKPEKYLKRHADGTVWAKGQVLAGKPSGYWQWFRKDGVRMRSGYFERGVQVGKWTTYDREGAVYKVTVMKPKPGR